MAQCARRDCPWKVLSSWRDKITQSGLETIFSNGKEMNGIIPAERQRSTFPGDKYPICTAIQIWLTSFYPASNSKPTLIKEAPLRAGLLKADAHSFWIWAGPVQSHLICHPCAYAHKYFDVNLMTLTSTTGFPKSVLVLLSTMLFVFFLLTHKGLSCVLLFLHNP